MFALTLLQSSAKISNPTCGDVVTAFQGVACCGATNKSLAAEVHICTPPEVPHKSIAIIGAGFAGMQAAKSLMGSVDHVTIFEAKDKTGGRAKTEWLVPGKLMTNLGASWLHESYPLEFGFGYGIKEALGLEISTTNENPLVDVANSASIPTRSMWNFARWNTYRNGAVSLPIFTKKQEFAKWLVPWHYTNQYGIGMRKSNPYVTVADVLQRIRREGVFADVNKIDGIIDYYIGAFNVTGFAQFKGMEPFASADAVVDMMSEYNSGFESVDDSLNSAEVFEWLGTYLAFTDDGVPYLDPDDGSNYKDVYQSNAYVEGSGFKGVFDALYQEVIPHVTLNLNSVVTSVETKHDGVHVTVGSNTQRFDAAIVTIPLGAMKHKTIAFTPQLPAGMLNAIHAIPFGLWTTVSLAWSNTTMQQAPWSSDFGPLQTDVALWSVDPSLPDGQVTPDFVLDASTSPGRFSVFYRLTEAEPGIHAINMIATGIASVEGDDSEMITKAREQLERLYGSVPAPDYSRVKQWGTDPHTFGSYSAGAPGEYETVDSDITRFRVALTDTEGSCHDRRLYFAGEHTETYWYGYTFGAAMTGHAAATKILTHNEATKARLR